MIDRSSYDAKLLREARLALSLVSVLAVAAAWLGYRYMTSLSPDRGIPRHVEQAPLATEVDAEFIAAATARRIDGISDPTRASREYPSQNLSGDRPSRLASNSSPDANAAFERPSIRMDRERSAPVAIVASNSDQPEPVAPLAQSVLPTANPSEFLDRVNPGDDREQLEFQRRQFHPQPLVPPIEQPSRDRQSSGLSAGNDRLRLAANSMPRLESAPVAGHREPPIANEAPADTLRMVHPQQSLWPIAQELYGNGQWFRALHEHNAERYRRAGASALAFSIECPPLDVLRATYPDLDPNAGSRPSGDEVSPARDTTPATNWYTTRESDTLFDIARTELGQAARYAELWELNRFRLPAEVSHLTRLPAGLQLQLPSTIQR